tara:strand:+ start:160 stop:411 length:252 start_codon:yes stop_codon:yes gene_type:complete
MEYLIAGYLGLWLMTITHLYYPAMKVLGVYDKNNIVYKHKIYGGILFALFSLFATPFIFPCLFSEHLREVFLKSYLKAVTGNE